MIRFASLGSGSAGNALLVESGATRILVDCGFGLREAAFRLGRLGVDPGTLTGVVVTHEHGDHLDPKAIQAIEKSGTEIIANENSQKPTKTNYVFLPLIATAYR